MVLYLVEREQQRHSRSDCTNEHAGLPLSYSFATKSDLFQADALMSKLILPPRRAVKCSQ